MKLFPALVMVAVSFVSTAVGTNIVAADTGTDSKPQAAVQSSALEQLKAQASSTTWQRPL